MFEREATVSTSVCVDRRYVKYRLSVTSVSEVEINNRRRTEISAAAKEGMDEAGSPYLSLFLSLSPSPTEPLPRMG